MSNLSAVVGDVNDIRIFQLAGVASLAGVDAIEAHVWSTTGAANLTGAVVDSGERTVSITLGGSSGWLSTATAGIWNMEIEATYSDGSILTWPTGRPIQLTVRAAGDPSA